MANCALTHPHARAPAGGIIHRGRSGANEMCRAVLWLWHCQLNESGTYEGRLIRDQAAVTAVHTVNARARNIR